LAHLVLKQGAILSEQFPSEVAPPEDEVTPQPAELSEADEPVERRSRSGWIAPAWFFFGIVVGVLGFALYTTLMTRAVAPASTAAAFDAVAVRSAARDGTLDAIATLQAGGGQPAAGQQQPQGPQEVASNAFTVRDANREGSPDARVTIYEFSDFQ
jgi:hypothetical protein